MSEEHKNTLLSIVRSSIAKHTLTINVLESKLSPIAPDCALGTLSRFELMGEQEIDYALLETTRQELDSLKKIAFTIDSPHYGLCKECDDEIAFERLMLMPAATFCIACANARDRR